MATLRYHISSIRGTHKLLSTDAAITDRVIASELRAQSLLLVKRETNQRKLWATDTLFTTLPCLPLKEVPVSECCAYADPCQVARTETKLPRIAEGNYQYIIQGVYSVNAMGGRGTRLKETTVNRYLNLQKLPLKPKGPFYWISDDYLYVSSPSLKAIRISALFEEDVPLSLLNPSCHCHNNSPICTGPLDREFFLPGYLQSQVYSLVSQRLLSTYFRIQGDNTSDGKDDQFPQAK